MLLSVHQGSNFICDIEFWQQIIGGDDDNCPLLRGNLSNGMHSFFSCHYKCLNFLFLFSSTITQQGNTGAGSVLSFSSCVLVTKKWVTYTVIFYTSHQRTHLCSLARFTIGDIKSFERKQQRRRLRPGRRENTGSRPFTAVNPCRARLVLGWVIPWLGGNTSCCRRFSHFYCVLVYLILFLFCSWGKLVHEDNIDRKQLKENTKK